MKAPPSQSGNVLRGESQEPNTRRKPQIKAKRACFDTWSPGYYPSVYSFAFRLTDDPREAIVLTRETFNSTREQLGSICDENLFASI
jgi:hypothetical protein